MTPIITNAWRYACLNLIAFILLGHAWAAPEYVTAWPKQVPVEKPDPVLGDKPFWEHWVYSEAFARRFKGFPVDKADPELKGGIQAMALRIFKTNLWQELNPNYPEQYACHIDVYFDSAIVLPSSTSGKPRKIFPAYPQGVTESYRRLEPYAESDKAALLASAPVPANLARQPLVFAAPLDGRFSAFGVHEYRQNMVPSISLLVLRSGLACSVTAPLQEGGKHWLSLFGDRPWDRTEGGPPKAIQGQYDRNIGIASEPGQYPESHGHLRIPKAFNKVALPKATLVKVLNWCIRQRHDPSDWQVDGITYTRQQLMYRCVEAEQHGRVLPDPRYYSGKEGLQDTGY